MRDLTVQALHVPATSPAAIAKVRELEQNVLALPQLAIETRHVLHAGMYARTITVPAEAVLTGALIKVATLLVIDGDTLVYLDGESVRLTGHHVLPAAAGRKTAFATMAETQITMIFPTTAKTVEEAEREFTDEAEDLGSRRNANHVVVTGE